MTQLPLALGRLARWLRRTDPRSELEAALTRLEAEAEAPALDFRASVLNRAGDLCAETGDRTRALAYYGRAIDCYLGAGYYDAATRMCGKVIDRFPEVVRARCTLAFLLMGAGLPYMPTHGIPGEARLQLQGYVAAARAAGTGEVAAQRLRMMSGVTELAEVRELIADLLFELGDTDAAADLVYAQFEERANLVVHGRQEQEQQRQRWAEMLCVAIMDDA